MKTSLHQRSISELARVARKSQLWSGKKRRKSFQVKEGPRASTFSLGLMFSWRKGVNDMNIGKSSERLSHVFYMYNKKPKFLSPEIRSFSSTKQLLDLVLLGGVHVARPVRSLAHFWTALKQNNSWHSEGLQTLNLRANNFSSTQAPTNKKSESLEKLTQVKWLFLHLWQCLTF